MGCCSRRPYEAVFDDAQARRDLARYRRKGLKQDAARAVAFLRERGIDGATVLEVGGGIGAVQRELLDAGAAETVAYELSSGYDTVAAELAAGYEDRVERRHADFAEIDGVEPADAVVLVRVVCCYPDPERLVGAAADATRRLLVLTYPVENRLVRLGLRPVNAVMRRLCGGFQAYAHPQALLREIAERHGLRLVYRERGLVWRTAGFERP